MINTVEKKDKKHIFKIFLYYKNTFKSNIIVVVISFKIYNFINKLMLYDVYNSINIEIIMYIYLYFSFFR